MKLSTTQAEVVRVLRKRGAFRLVRLHGGYWTTECDRSHKGPLSGWSVTISTIRSMERKGLLRRENVYPEEWRDHRVLTQAATKVEV